MFEKSISELSIDFVLKLFGTLDGNIENIRPTAIDVKIYNENQLIYEEELSSDNNWSFNGNALTATNIALSGVTGADDLKAIEGLTATSGFLKKTAVTVVP